MLKNYVHANFKICLFPSHRIGNKNNKISFKCPRNISLTLCYSIFNEGNLFQANLHRRKVPSSLIQIMPLFQSRRQRPTREITSLKLSMAFSISLPPSETRSWYFRRKARQLQNQVNDPNLSDESPLKHKRKQLYYCVFWQPQIVILNMK